MNQTMLKDYQLHMKERQDLGIPPLPLSEEQVRALSEHVFAPPSGKKDLILKLLNDHVPPGVDPAALEKSKILRSIALCEKTSSLIAPEDAVRMIGMMKGGYNLETLVELLEDHGLLKFLDSLTAIRNAGHQLPAFHIRSDGDWRSCGRVFRSILQ